MPCDAGDQVVLANDLDKRPVVLAFYMGDFGASCRQQLGQLQQHLLALRQEGAVVLGLSIARPGVARRTVTKLGLQFPLLSDP